MKKTALLLLGLLFLLPLTCFAQEADPAMVLFDDFSVSIGDIEIADEFWNNGADFEIRKDNTVKSITVTGEEIGTYQNIHVGDSINKVRSKYLLEIDENDAIGVLLDGYQELDLAAISEMDESEYTDEIKRAILIEYDYENGKVTQIIINRVADYLGLNLAETENVDPPQVELYKEQVYVDGTVVTYNEPVPDTLMKYTVTNALGKLDSEDAPLKIVVNDEGIVRCITILDNSVWTYDGIRVGMPITQVTEQYEKNIGMGYVYLYYQGDDMLEMDDLPTDEECLIYTYYRNDGKIGMISICDSVYAKIMK